MNQADQLKEYVESQLRQGVSKILILNQLVKAGYSQQQVSILLGIDKKKDKTLPKSIMLLLLAIIILSVAPFVASSLRAIF